MLITILIYVLLFLLVALVSGNNLSVCLGAIIGSRTVSRNTGIAVAILGYIAGFLAEGSFLHAGLVALLPFQSAALVALALGIGLVIFLISHIVRVPQSLSITFAMTLIGIGLGYNGTFNSSYVFRIVYFLAFAVAISFVSTIIIMRSIRKAASKLNVWSTVNRIKLMLLIMSFFAAFVLGANTIGFVYASTTGLSNQLYGMLITVVAIVLGSILLSAGELNRLGAEILPLRYINALVSQSVTVILLEAATLLSIPAPNTWMFTASVYGAGVSYRTRMIRRRPLYTIASSWIGMSLIALLLGFVSTFVIYHL